MKFVCPLIAVEDVAVSRRFYEELLGQKVKFDFGENVTFMGDFAIHLKTHFAKLLDPEAARAVAVKAHNGELYFETDEPELFEQRLKSENIEWIHPIKEQPWGQRVMRVYDPDGHVVEIGETMETVVRRFQDRGLSIDRIKEKTSLPLEFLERVLREPQGS